MQEDQETERITLLNSTVKAQVHLTNWRFQLTCDLDLKVKVIHITEFKGGHQGLFIYQVQSRMLRPIQSYKMFWILGENAKF